MRIGHSLLSSDRDFGYRHGNPSPKIGEIKSTKINIISNSQGVELYNVLPNNSVCFGDYFPLKL